MHFALLATSAAAPSESGKLVTLFQYIHDGGILSYVLIALSILAVALTVRNAMAIRYTEFAPPAAMATLEQLLGEGRVIEAERFCNTPANRCFVTTVLGEAFQHARASEFGLLEFRGAVEESARGEADEVHRMNDGLGVIAAVGPMLGLLGTVIGMIGAFRAIGGLQGAARSNELATFMSMALVNTAEGLVVAIPATIAFALFRRRIDRIMHRLGNDLERFAGLISSNRGRSVPARDAALGAGGPNASAQPGGVPAPARKMQ